MSFRRSSTRPFTPRATRPCTRLVAQLLVGLLAIAGLSTEWAATAHAGTTGIAWSLDRNTLWAIGVDKVYPVTGSPGGYEYLYEYPLSNHGNNPVMRSPLVVSDSRALEQIRMEFYNRCSLVPSDPRHCITQTATVAGNDQYSPWEGDSGVAVRINPAASVNIGTVRAPRASDANAGKLNISLVSRQPIPDNRMKITLFQTTGQPRTNTGYQLDAFAHGWNRGAAFNTGPLWNGRYLAFIYDYEVDGTSGKVAYKHRILGFVNVNGTTNVTFDMDAACFGIDECHTLEPTPPVAGEFHPLPTTRIVDTRANRGIVGPITPGDGRSSDGRPAVRLATKLNHELKVTGVAGIPATGVSAVLLNVTSLNQTAGGTLAMVPKPPKTRSVFDEQASFGAAQTALGQIQWRPGHIVSSQVLVRVGVGGRIRLDSRSLGSTHLLVDVVGWYDSSQPGQNGLGVTAVDSARVFDTRTGLGTPLGTIPVGGVRTATLAGLGGIPADAQGVIASVSDTPIGGSNFFTVWPSGAARPGSATIAATPGQPRANMVTALLGAGGAWGIYNGGPAVGNAAVDVQGWLGPQVSTAGRVTVTDATRVLAPALLATNASVKVSVASRITGVINPKAVYVMVTMNGANTSGFLTVGDTLPVPGTVSMRYATGVDRSNLMLVPLAPDGTFVIRNTASGAAGAGFVAVDLVGVVTGA